MFDLNGKKALVTGASGGLGGAIARALHAQGATVTLSAPRSRPWKSLPDRWASAAICCQPILPTRQPVKS